MHGSCGAKNVIMTRKSKIIILLLVALLSGSCTSRVAYEPTILVERSVDAININTASADELEKLPHIGRKTAENIVRFREENGPFRRPEHLMQIRGISEKRYLELYPYLRTE